MIEQCLVLLSFYFRMRTIAKIIGVKTFSTSTIKVFFLFLVFALF